MATNCEDVSAQMMELLYGELPVDARADVDAHVAGCARCRAELDGFEKTRAVARQALDVDEAPPASARAAIMKAAAAHLATQAQPTAAARKAVPRETASFWDRLRAAWAFPTLATIGAVAVFMLANRVFLNPERALDRPQVATQEAPASPPAPPAAERQGWDGKPTPMADSEAKGGHRSRWHAHGRSGKSGDVDEAELPREPERSTAAGRADDQRWLPKGTGERSELRERAKATKKTETREGRFAEPPPAKPAAEEKPSRDQPLAKEKQEPRFAPPPPPREAPAAKLKPADKAPVAATAEAPVDSTATRSPAPSRRAPAKVPTPAQANTLDNLLEGEAEKPRGGGGKASNKVVGGLAGPGNKSDRYGSGAGAATRAPAAPRSTVSDTDRSAPAPVAEAAPAAPAMAPAAPVMAPAPPPPPTAAPKTRAKKSNVAAGDDADFAASESAAKDEKKAAGKNAAAETLMQRADRFFAEGRWSEAAAIYRELLRRDPRNQDTERWRRRLVAAENAEVNERRNANVAAKRAAEGYEKSEADRAEPARARKSAKPASKATSSDSQ